MKKVVIHLSIWIAFIQRAHMSESTPNEVVNSFIEKTVGISIPKGMRLVRKQFKNSIPEVLVYLMKTRECYFNLKKQHTDVETEVLSLIASISVALTAEKQMSRPIVKAIRRQVKKDFLLDRSSLIIEWISAGYSYRDISKHLVSHHRKEISPTYIHRVCKEMGWSDKGGKQL